MEDNVAGFQWEMERNVAGLPGKILWDCRNSVAGLQ